MRKTIQFTRSDGTKVTIENVKVRRSSARTLPELKKRLEKVPPALRKVAMKKWLEARGRTEKPKTRARTLAEVMRRLKKVPPALRRVALAKWKAARKVVKRVS